MSNLINVPKDGNLANRNSNQTFPNWSSFLDEIFNRDLSSTLTSSFNSGFSVPKVNIKESSDDYMVEMAAPGLKKSDFQIEINNKVLSISAESEQKKEQQEENYTRKEFGYAAFKRIFTLPESVNDDEVKATYKDGILNILLPKKEEAKQKPIKSIKIS